jgi:hypothetical protein
MVYREPGFLAIILFGYPFLPLFNFNKLDQRDTGRLRKRDNLLVREGGWAYDSRKAWPSINHSILSAPACTPLPG